MPYDPKALDIKLAKGKEKLRKAIELSMFKKVNRNISQSVVKGK